MKKQYKVKQNRHKILFIATLIEITLITRLSLAADEAMAIMFKKTL